MIEFERPKTINEALSITPLIDVIFLLLLFFMLTSVFIQPGISLDLPEAATAEFPDEYTGLVVYISRFGEIVVNEQVVAFDEMVAVITEEIARHARPQVTIQADKEVAFGLFVQVLDAAREAGGETLMISAEFPASAGSSNGR